MSFPEDRLGALMRPPHLVLLVALLAALVLATPSPSQGRVVAGMAVDPQGQPVTGAAVWLPPYVLTAEAYAAYVQAGPAAVTGSDGRFTVSLPDDVEGIQIDVCAPGSLTGHAGSGAAGPLTVVVRPGARIFGRVIDAAGDPVAGIYVGTMLAGSAPSDLVLQSSPCNHSGIDADVLTDRAGRFTLAPLEPGWYTVRAGDGLVESAPVRLAAGQALGGLRLAIEHGAQVAGRVTARDGSPVPRATVSLGSATTTTDAAGLYRLTGVPPGPINVMSTEGRHGTLYRQTEITPGENRLDLTLPDPTLIRGRVLRPDGGPAAGATVAMRTAHTATAADGTFLLSVPTSGSEETLTVQAAGLAPAEVVVKDEPAPLDIRLSRPGSIAGRIVGLRTPAGTRITAESFLFTRQLLEAEAVADAAGRFRLPALAPGTWVLTATQEERVNVADIAVAPGKESALDIAFPPTHRVSGWVVDGDGRPVACDEVTFSRIGNPISAPCRADGTFIAEVEDGSYDPEVSAGGRGRFHEPLTVEVAGVPVDRIEIRLLAPVVVTGRILGLQPGEIPDDVQAERTGDTYVLRSSTGTADQDGGYRLEILPGDWEIRVHFALMTVQKYLHVPPDATQIDADLTFPTGPYVLTGRAAGEKAYFELIGEDGFRVTSSLIAPGEFRFSRLAAGTYTLRAHASNGDLLLERTVQVPAAATHPGSPNTELVVDVPSR